MPPTERPIPRFAAEPSKQLLPEGRFAESLAAHFLEACARIDAEEELGDPHEIVWFPDRTLGGRTYVPATAQTPNGYELFGFVSFVDTDDEQPPTDFHAEADFTEDTADANPDWKLDLSDYQLTSWQGPDGRRGEMVLVWGVALISDGAVATTELGPTTTDQCQLSAQRFSLVSLDNYGGDLLEVKLWTKNGSELCAESIYEEEE
jgi:hypothetical protein